MARRTHTFARAHGCIEAAYEYEDRSGRVLRLVIRNDHPTLTVEMGVEGWTHTAGPASGTTRLDIPARYRHAFELVPDGGDPERPDAYPTIDVRYWMRLL